MLPSWRAGGVNPLRTVKLRERELLRGFTPPLAGFMIPRAAVEREAFARARRFLDYSPAAKWTALAAAVGTGILYVALLIVLGLFTDLVVSRGIIPAYKDLPPRQQQAFLATVD